MNSFFFYQLIPSAWMDIDGASLLYGLGLVDNACNQIDALLKQEK